MSYKPIRQKYRSSASIYNGETIGEILAKIPPDKVPTAKFVISYGYYEEVDYEIEWEVDETEEDYQMRLKKWEEKQAKKAAKR